MTSTADLQSIAGVDPAPIAEAIAARDTLPDVPRPRRVFGRVLATSAAGLGLGTLLLGSTLVRRRRRRRFGATIGLAAI